MAFPTFDSVFSITPSTTATWTHTVTASQSNLCLLVAVNCISSTGKTTTGVTYAGVAMTKIQGFFYNGANDELSFWVLAGPATGANTVSVTFSGSALMTG